MNAAEYKFVSRCDGLEDGYYLHDAGKDTDCIVWLHGHNANGGQPFFQKNINEKIEPVVQKYNVSLFSPHLRGNVWMSEAAVADLHDLLLATVIKSAKHGNMNENPKQRRFLVHAKKGQQNRFMGLGRNRQNICDAGKETDNEILEPIQGQTHPPNQSFTLYYTMDWTQFPAPFPFYFLYSPII